VGIGCKINEITFTFSELFEGYAAQPVLLPVQKNVESHIFSEKKVGLPDSGNLTADY
jgi:hypothetical protein